MCGFQGGASIVVRTKATTSFALAAIADLLNNAREPTYRPSSEKISMSEINQPPSGDLDTSPPKTTTQHSRANDSDHETALTEEDEAGVNPNPMVVDELVEDGDNPGDNSYNIEGTINPQEEGSYVKDTVMEEENEGNQTPVPVGNDDEGSEERKDDTGEGHAQNQTLVTPTIKVIPMGGVSTSSTRGLSAERLTILKRSQPVEYLKTMLSCRESSSKKSISTASRSKDQPSSTPADEVLSKIKDKIFKGGLFLLMLADPSAPLTLKPLLNQVDLLETSPNVANIV